MLVLNAAKSNGAMCVPEKFAIWAKRGGFRKLLIAAEPILLVCCRVSKSMN
jgi:hypothetical protein